MGSLKQAFADACGINFKCQEAAAFLATGSKALPVDAYKMRNSLHDTAFMRTPRQATVNVIEREGLSGAADDGKFVAMRSRAARLRQEFEDGLATLAWLFFFFFWKTEAARVRCLHRPQIRARPRADP